jgi:hypothetical protein
MQWKCTNTGCDKENLYLVDKLQDRCALFLTSLLEGVTNDELPSALARDLDMHKIIKILKVQSLMDIDLTNFILNSLFFSS